MSKQINLLLLFVGIGLVSTLIYFGLNSNDDSKNIESNSIVLTNIKSVNNGISWKVTGLTYFPDQQIDIFIKNPDSMIISENKIYSADDGHIEFEITTGGPLWNKPGNYSVVMIQGESSTTTSFILDKSIIDERNDFIKSKS